MKNNIRIMVRVLLPACLVLMSAATLYAGAWTMEKGKSYHRFAANYYLAEEEYDNDGDSRDMPLNGEFRDFNLNYYMEYGIFDQLTVLGSLYYKDIRKDDDVITTKTNGLGDLDLGLRYRLHSGDAGIFSIQGLTKIPDLYDEDDALPLGNGQNDYELRLLYGRSLWPFLPGYVNLEAGYRWRVEDPADEFRYLVEIGSDLGKDFYVRTKLDAIVSMDNADPGMDNFGNPASTLEYNLAKLDVTAGWWMTRTLGLELGYAPALWGENTAKGATWTLALTFQPGK
ncbi:MAG: hypothetical protein WA081_20090 [Desulfosalsimonadaceae bacterium]